MKKFKVFLASVASLALISATSDVSAQLLRAASGPDSASIQGAVDLFRLDLGTLNPNVAGSFGTGRREINWDGVPDAFAAPNNLPADFFNVTSPRGVVMSTPGTGFQVSATSASGGPVQFGNIDPGYPAFFEPFSPERLFTAVGSNILDVNFFVPGTNTPALTRGFGSVFSDVDVANTSSLEFFDASDNSLGTFFVPNAFGNETFSFLGVSFPTPLVSRVRLVSGSQVLAPGNLATDLVVMDDFLFGEPVPRNIDNVPDATSGLLLLAIAIGSISLLQVRWPLQQRA